MMTRSDAVAEPAVPTRAARWLVGVDCSYPVLFWPALVGGTVAAWADGAPRIPVLVVAAALAGWYAWWTPPRLAAGPATALGYFAGAGAAWLALWGLDRGYGIVGIVLAVRLFGYLRWRSAFAGLVVVSAIVVAGTGLAGSIGGGLSWRGIEPAAAGQTALTLALVALCLYLGHRATLAREQLAAAQRRIGMLDERARLAADLHDTITQDLAGAVLLLEAAQDIDRRGDAGTGRSVERALDTVRGAAAQVRDLVWDLRSESPDETDLPAVLRQLAAETADRTGARAEVVVTGTWRRLPRPISHALLRIAQEGLANVARHAHAKQITTTLSYRDASISLDLADDGAGFDPTAAAPPRPSGGLGLPGMRRRAHAVGGRLGIESDPGEGTCLTVIIPLETLR